MARTRPAGGVRAALRTMIASRNEIEAAEERQETARTGCTAVADLAPRRRAEVSGVLRSVRLRPATEVPALEAELYDGSGSLRVVFLGRRAVAGIEPGSTPEAGGPGVLPGRSADGVQPALRAGAEAR